MQPLIPAGERIQGSRGRQLVGLALVALCLLAASCATGPRFHKVTPAYSEGEDTFVLDLPYFSQKKDSCCGAACLAMLAGYWKGTGAGADMNTGSCPEEGFSGGELVEMAERAGFSALLFKTDLAGLLTEVAATRPVIVMLGAQGGRHYAVCYGFSQDRGQVVLADPGRGRVYCSNTEFMQSWRQAKGFALVVVEQPAGEKETTQVRPKEQP
ncbi:MAG: cysteine peptidase family C39 domain-containing protein [Thermodesulfobacteriota bacterium]